MNELYESIKAWFFALGENYGVKPIIFGSIYVGTIPLFSISIAWLVRNYRKKESIILPGFSAIFFFISAYLYLIIVGRNVPFWVYALMILMVLFGVYLTVKK